MVDEFPTRPVPLSWSVTILFIRSHVGQYLIGTTNIWTESSNVNIFRWSVWRFLVYCANGRKYTDDIGLVREIPPHFIPLMIGEAIFPARRSGCREV